MHWPGPVRFVESPLTAVRFVTPRRQNKAPRHLRPSVVPGPSLGLNAAIAVSVLDMARLRRISFDLHVAGIRTALLRQAGPPVRAGAGFCTTVALGDTIRFRQAGFPFDGLPWFSGEGLARSMTLTGEFLPAGVPSASRPVDFEAAIPRESYLFAFAFFRRTYIDYKEAVL